MATVYSNRFLQARGLSSSLTYIVPAGYRAVLRDVDSYYNGTFGDTIFLEGAAGQTIWSNHFSPSTGSGEYASWRGRQIVEEGESFTVTASDGVDVTVSGYLLTLP